MPGLVHLGTAHTPPPAHRGSLEATLDQPDDRQFAVAMGALVLAIANVERALKHESPLESPLELPPLLAQRYHAAGLEAVLRQNASAVGDAVEAAGALLRDLVVRALEDPECAIGKDPLLRALACSAWARLVLDTFQSELNRRYLEGHR